MDATLYSKPVHKSGGCATAADGASASAKTNTNAATAETNDADASPSGSNSSQENTALETIPTGDMDMWKQLELEKSKYPGASTWAPDEERLFELLFFRQDLPILPSHWELDLRAVPISEANFADAEHPPVVYAHSKDFLATTALVRLIELTAAVRTASESGLHQRVPGMIKDGLDRFLAWAAEDGGYHHRRVVPNAIIEVVDTRLPERAITELLQGRMRALARLQREFLREDRDPDFWRKNSSKQTALNSAEEDRGHLLQQGYLSPRRKRHINKLHPPGGTPWGKHRRKKQLSDNTNSTEDELNRSTPPQDSQHATAAPRRHRTFAGSGDADDLDELSTSPAIDPVKYRRPPPVVYGFFILNSSVFILTADASLGDHAYVSFHVEADFMEHRQSVWNALTLAMVACLARDEMRERADDFEPQPEEVDSDPDL